MKKIVEARNQEQITQAEPKKKSDEQCAKYHRWYSSSDCYHRIQKSLSAAALFPLQKREEATQSGKTTQARTTDPT